MDINTNIFDVEKAFDNIMDAMDKIHLNKVTVLTGENASGKSLIRKCVGAHLQNEYTGSGRIKVCHSSMEQRTGLHSEMGGGGVFLRDVEWIATSINSIDFIKRVLNENDRYIILDEPEIGLSESIQYSLAHYLNKVIPEIIKKNLGILIITHSKVLVKALSICDEFVNIQGKTYDEWINAEPELIDIEELSKNSDALYLEINKHLRTVKD